MELALNRRSADGSCDERSTAVRTAFLLGLLVTLLGERFAVAPWVRASLTIGFLGAYTTFSTLSLESYRLLEGRSYALAGANLVGSLAAARPSRSSGSCRCSTRWSAREWSRSSGSR
jgi:CrcB-like protein, Camphor Resistance (CrcB)